MPRGSDATVATIAWVLTALALGSEEVRKIDTAASLAVHSGELASGGLGVGAGEDKRFVHDGVPTLDTAQTVATWGGGIERARSRGGVARQRGALQPNAGPKNGPPPSEELGEAAAPRALARGREPEALQPRSHDDRLEASQASFAEATQAEGVEYKSVADVVDEKMLPRTQSPWSAHFNRRAEAFVSGGRADVFHMDPISEDGGSRDGVCPEQMPVVTKLWRKKLPPVKSKEDLFNRDEFKAAVKDACVANSFAKLQGHSHPPPPVLKIVDAQVVHGQLFVLMEHGGLDLFEEVTSKRKCMQKAATPRELANYAVIVYHVLSSVRRMHDLGVVHCDLKPENIMVIRGGGALPQAKVIDFDEAGKTTENHAPFTSVRGTRGFLSPTRALGMGCSQESDVWVLGRITWEMVFGENWYKSTPSDLREEHREGKRRQSGILSTMTSPIVMNEKLSKKAHDMNGKKHVPFVLSLPGRLWSMIQRLVAENRTDPFMDVVRDARDLALEAAAFAADAAAFQGKMPLEVSAGSMRWSVEPSEGACAGPAVQKSDIWRWLDNRTLQECLALTPRHG